MGIETVLLGVSVAATLAGGAVSAMGAQQQAEASAASNRYQSQVAANNALIAQQNAQYAREAGQAAAYQNQYKIRRAIGEQKAQQGASGIDVNSGSPLDVRVSTAELGELDTLTLLNNAEREAYGYESQATNFMAQSRLDLMEADNDRTAGKFGVAKSLIGAASGVSDKWLSYKKVA